MQLAFSKDVVQMVLGHRRATGTDLCGSWLCDGTGSSSSSPAGQLVNLGPGAQGKSGFAFACAETWRSAFLPLHTCPQQDIKPVLVLGKAQRASPDY